jgi:hypothetical protein
VCLLSVLVPILACSPRFLLRFVRGLAGVATAASGSELAWGPGRASVKRMGLKAVPQRALKISPAPHRLRPEPPWAREERSGLRPLSVPLHFPEAAGTSRKVELLKPSYLQSAWLRSSGPLPPG